MFFSATTTTRAAHRCTGSALLLVAACGGKEHPAGLMDDTSLHKEDAGMVVIQPMVDGSANIPDAASTDPLVLELAKKCEKPPYGAFLCYATEKGHPAETAVFRNMDARNGVVFEFAIDAAHAQFDSIADYQGHEWKLTVVAPMGQELVPGSYSTAANGAVLGFSWDTGMCPDVQTATFDVYAMAWDDKGVPTTAEIDFKHHCGDLSSPGLFGKYRLNSPRP